MTWAVFFCFLKQRVGDYWGVVPDLVSPFSLSGHDHRTDGIHICSTSSGGHTDFEKIFQNLVGERRSSTF